MQYRDGIALTWTNGRKLASLTNGSRTTTFTYDGDGNRIRKEEANDSVDYTVINGVIYAEKRQALVTNTLHYLFDENGTRIGFIHNGTDAYYYRFNLQGDVTGIFNASGILITEYFYDAWGKLEKTTGNYFIGLLNPIRYRGYYFDMETGLYYLNTRYYDPETGRFINADVLLSTHKKSLISNIFVYCLNNPTKYIDSNGEDAILLICSERVGGCGHMGLMLQDSDGTWYHFYWGSSGSGSSGKKGVSDTLVPVPDFVPSGDISKVADQLSQYYSGAYDDMIYFRGDFSKSVDYAFDLDENYNFLFNNCSQQSLKVLSHGSFDSYDTLYKIALYALGTNPMPVDVFAKLSLFDKMIKGVSSLKRSQPNLFSSNRPRSLNSIDFRR